MPLNIQGGDFSNINDFDAASEVPKMIVQTISEGVVFLTRDLLVGDQETKQKRRDNFYKPSRSRKSPTTPRPPKAPKPRKKKSFVNKSLAAKAVGIGTRKQTPRAANSNDIRRAGRTALSQGNRALARFIAARYSPKAIAKYNDYAGRLRRSKRLIKQIVQIDANTFRIRRHIIKTDTAGNNPYSCTCPDFSQFSSEESRDWLGSAAGPFNPCKHMMAVRDRATAGSKWSCSGGVCSASDSGYDTKADCERAVRLANFKGGQCGGGALYIIQLSADNITWTTYSGALNGPIISFTVQRNITGDRWTTYVKASPQEGFNEIPSATAINASAEPYKRVVYIGGGSAGDCGDPPQNNCPL